MSKYLFNAQKRCHINLVEFVRFSIYTYKTAKHFLCKTDLKIDSRFYFMTLMPFTCLFLTLWKFKMNLNVKRIYRSERIILWTRFILAFEAINITSVKSKNILRLEDANNSILGLPEPIFFCITRAPDEDLDQIYFKGRIPFFWRVESGVSEGSDLLSLKGRIFCLWRVESFVSHRA